jgi:hypothetical protein
VVATWRSTNRRASSPSPIVRSPPDRSLPVQPPS